MIGVLQRVEDLCASIGRVAGWITTLALVAAVAISVVAVQMRVNVLATWDASLPLFGRELTLNSLTDLQWHLFAVMVMLGGVYALRADAHVSVDFIAVRLSGRTRAVIRVLGDLVFLVPFTAIMTWFSWRFMMAAYNSGEGSTYGGMLDRWVIKAVMPLGFGLLTLFGVVRAVRTVLVLASDRADTIDTPASWA